MGQPITVVETTSTSNPAVRRYETNRPLSGMGHERYEDPPSELRRRPVDELARRLFAAGGVQKIHINSSMVTVTLTAGHQGAGLADVIRQLFLHYGDSESVPMEAPTSDADNTPESLADSGDAPSAVSSADEAPAPDRPESEEPAADQAIPGVPEALSDEAAPDESPGDNAAVEVPGADAGPGDIAEPDPSEAAMDGDVRADADPAAEPKEPSG